MVTAHAQFLAHHYLLLAVPAFLPAVIVVAVVLYVALRDRRADRTSTSAGAQPAGPDTPDENRD